ncbi:hypothetical protein KY359_04565 [Candidatus Woesearchaeota archaeon]|nr:hypothetical protein [Candidatus Woesearchaeota archaeon]
MTEDDKEKNSITEYSAKDVIIEIAGWFDEPEKAKALLRDSYNRCYSLNKLGGFVDGEGTFYRVSVFYEMHKEAHRRRQENGITNDVRLLENELKGSAWSGKITEGRVKRALSLEELERRLK